jgi:hypothetical protein
MYMSAMTEYVDPSDQLNPIKRTLNNDFRLWLNQETDSENTMYQVFLEVNRFDHCDHYYDIFCLKQVNDIFLRLDGYNQAAL